MGKSKLGFVNIPDCWDIQIREFKIIFENISRNESISFLDICWEFLLQSFWIIWGYDQQIIEYFYVLGCLFLIFKEFLSCQLFAGL